MIGSEAMGAPPYKGEQRTRRSHHLRARSRPNLPSYESLYGLSRTGLRKRPSGGKCRPLWKIHAAHVGIHRRLPCKAQLLNYSAAGFVLRTVDCPEIIEHPHGVDVPSRPQPLDDAPSAYL